MSTDSSASSTCPSSSSTRTPDAFRVEERRYKLPHEPDIKKRKKVRDTCDYSDVIDLHNLSNNTEYNRSLIHQHTLDPSISPLLSPQAKLYSITSIPGFFIITHALPQYEQIRWAHVALSQYACTEHTNLTNLAHLAGQDVPNVHKHVWHEMMAHDKNSPEYIHARQELTKLRWASLGYHYNWTERTYRADAYSPFPTELAELSSQLASLVGYQLKAEASIVNFYPVSSMMGAHVDDAELTAEHPIVSISLGNTAIFLLGGRTRDIRPHAFYLRSGDISIMGSAARLCYHGVPRMLRDTWNGDDAKKAWNDIVQRQQEEKSKAIEEESKEHVTLIQPLPKLSTHEFESVLEYLSVSRINMNIRQVESETCTFASRELQNRARAHLIAQGKMSAEGMNEGMNEGMSMGMSMMASEGMGMSMSMGMSECHDDDDVEEEQDEKQQAQDAATAPTTSTT